LFLGYLLVHQRYKVIAAAIVAILGWSLLSMLRYGVSPLLTYTDVFGGLLHQFLLTTNSQSLAAKLAVGHYAEFQHFLANQPEILSQPIGSAVATLTTEYQVVQRIYTVYIVVVLLLSAFLTWRGEQSKEPFFITTALGMMLAPNILWYHHYVFLLLPLLVWMGWSHLDTPVVVWCCIGLLIVQIDRRFPPYGLIIHLFSNVSMLIVLYGQIRQFHAKKAASKLMTAPG
jgi:hypothetical protein